MPHGKLLKSLLKKFKWKFLFLLFLTFLISYLSFLIHFNLRTNLSFNNNIRGKFYYLFGEYSVIQKIKSGSAVYVNWSKLLLILFLLHFPIKLIIKFTLNYFRKIYEREAKVYLSKKLLAFAYKNKDLITKKASEKVYILNEIVPNFSRYFFTIPLNLFGLITDISLEIFSFYFLIRTRNLTDLVPLIFLFILVNLIWIILFNHLVKRSRKINNKKQINYQQEEKTQVRTFLENLNTTNNKTGDLTKLCNSLDRNSKKFSLLTLTNLFFSLPDLIISGFTILFLFLYYQFYRGGQGGLYWNDYFIANNLQSIFLKVKKGQNLLTNISICQENYQKIEGFFS